MESSCPHAQTCFASMLSTCCLSPCLPRQYRTVYLDPDICSAGTWAHLEMENVNSH
ncbi:hypothetical protein I79_005515 [Cricetulus griseus]|uniref:Uncharacterized protein n=1 Tax=Cricetulus griseus TaxID=10029 RepID=G3H5F1_CRIGR|nr:hypothetical protein I79_005515 [Cricetulus griseus]